MPETDPARGSDTPYDPDAIFREDGPINPRFIDDQVQALMRAHQLSTAESEAAQQRHLESSIIGLGATNPRDAIEVMLGVQALSAYQAACHCWRIGMNGSDPDKNMIRHMSAAASAARTFDTMLRGLERRQAKPLSVPVGRPEGQIWHDNGAGRTLGEIAQRIRFADARPVAEPPPEPTLAVDPSFTWTPQALAIADEMLERDRIEQENEGLDIANTEGILPGGGMILMEDPTPEQKAYMGRRLALMYRREYRENLRKGITDRPKIRGIRPGDLIP